MILRAMRICGALALLAVGAVHLQEYAGSGYDRIPTIGTLFLLNAIGCAVVGIGLLAPIRRWFAQRRSDMLTGLLALGGVLIAAGSLIALFISEAGTLFGFSEHGYRTAIIAAIAAEAVTIFLLGPVAVAAFARLRADRHRRIAGSPGHPLRAL